MEWIGHGYQAMPLSIHADCANKNGQLPHRKITFLLYLIQNFDSFYQTKSNFTKLGQAFRHISQSLMS